MDVDGAEGETGFLYYGKIFYILQDAQISKESVVITALSIRKAISELSDILPWCNSF